MSDFTAGAFSVAPASMKCRDPFDFDAPTESAISPDSNFKYGDLIRERVLTLEEDIINRHPELHLGPVIDEYAAALEAEAGPEWTLKRVRECHPVDREGQLFGVKDIEDIVTGKIEITTPARPFAA